MNIRNALLASVFTVVLAASAAPAWSAASTPETQLAAEAYKALQAGDAETAVADYSKAIDSRALPPDVLANALLNRGLAYQRLNEHEFAIDDYTAALRVDALSGKVRALALYNRGLSYQRLQRNALAMEDFTSALFLDAEFSHAYYSRGTLLRAQGCAGRHACSALSQFCARMLGGHPLLNSVACLLLEHASAAARY